MQTHEQGANARAHGGTRPVRFGSAVGAKLDQARQLDRDGVQGHVVTSPRTTGCTKIPTTVAVAKPEPWAYIQPEAHIQLEAHETTKAIEIEVSLDGLSAIEDFNLRSFCARLHR